MLPKHVDHSTFCSSIERLTNRWNPAWGSYGAWQKVIDWVTVANLDAFVPILRAFYNPTAGRMAIDPVAMFRALSLMNVVQESSITRFVARLHRSPLLAALCGFADLDTVPAVATFYTFLGRLYPEPNRRRGCRRRPSGRRLNLKPGQKMPPRREGAIGRVARRVEREAKRPPRQRITQAWDHLLKIAALESVGRGVLPTTWDLAFDATPIESGAHSFGRKICACESKRCQCLRYFSDPMALLGRDSYRNRYYFGYSPQVAVVANPGPDGKSHPLIVSLALHPANRPDGAAFPDLLVKTQQLYTDSIALRRVIADAAYDVTELWAFTKNRGLTPVFAPAGDIKPPTLSDAATAAGMHLDADYRPICAQGRSLASRGEARRGVRTWACPLQNKKSPPCPSPCAKANKTVTVNFRGSRYDEIGLPYRSEAWNAVYNLRTGVERSFGVWTSQSVRRARHRRPYLWFGRLATAAITSHVNAWLRQDELAA